MVAPTALVHYPKAMDIRNKQIPKPRHWQELEDLCLSLFKSIWKNPLAQKNGRVGQPQNGVDIWGVVGGKQTCLQGVQCKGKDDSLSAKLTLSELNEEIAKAEKFSPPLEQWILATTAPSDVELQRIARELSVERERQGKFSVQIFGWGDLESLLCDHPNVLEAHYPELGTSFTTLTRKFTQIALTCDKPSLIRNSRSRGETIDPTWQQVAFYQSRDIGPALLGRALGPSDALACPKLPEVSSTIKQLEMAFSAHLVGEPGSGKSVCAFQVAYSFAQQGWQVFTSSGSDGLPAALPKKENGQVLLLIDDAHLLAPAELRSLADYARPEYLILCTHNAINGHTSQRGAIRMDPQAGIEAIWRGLLKDRQATLNAVRRADNHVGDSMMDVALEDRIEHAAKYASAPWQFCFVLGGGWRRADEAANIAKVLGASLPLAVIAVRQIASRDARLKLGELFGLLSSIGADTDGLELQLDALIEERIVLAKNDLRCPHQRLAAVLLPRLLRTQSESTISLVGAMLKSTLADEQLPLGGIGALLHELWFSDDSRWQFLITWIDLKPVLERCWKASEANEISAACYVIHEMLHWPGGSVNLILQGNESKLIEWLETAQSPMGHGLSRLLNGLLSRDEQNTIFLIRKASPYVVAHLISNVDATNIWHIGSVAKSLRLWSGDSWTKEVSSSLKSEPLLALSASWPEGEPLHKIIELLEALIYLHEDLTLSMVEALVPEICKRLMTDPVMHFREISDLAWHVLRVLDPLGTCKGKMAPSKRRLQIARSIFVNVDLKIIGAKLCQAPLRMFQQVYYLLACVRRVSPSMFQALVQYMDWERLASTIGEHWKHLPHDAEILLGVASSSTKTKQKIADLIKKNLWRMESMPPRLAYIAPTSAIEFVRSGKEISIANTAHVQWILGAYLIDLFSKEAPELVAAVVKQCIPTVAKSLSEEHPSWYKDSSILVECVLKYIPEALQQAFDQMAPEKAQVGWTAALEAGGGSKKSALLLIKAARDRNDGVGACARQLEDYSNRKKRKRTCRTQSLERS
ncbi:hypothetical protein C8C89_3203 [Janthinobacterium sp. 75]|nr:hypothetical protein C8C89_3203 [Janthinobacterium sp. 75]